MNSQIPPHIMLKDTGDLWIKGKANSISKQIEALAEHARLGKIPSQDIDPCAEHYDARASFKAVI